MGLEARCAITWQGSSWTAAVHLDSAALEVRGPPRLVLLLRDVRRVAAAAGQVTLETADGTMTLGLGAAAEQWARKIAAPPSRGKKLGIQPGQRVSWVGLSDPAFEAELTALGAELVSARSSADLVFLRADAAGDLAVLAGLRRRIEPDGAVWVVRTKGKGASLGEGDVRAAARAAGLVDVKVAAFSETLTADKFVIPVAERPRTAKAPSAPATKRRAGKAAKTKPVAASKKGA
jgi:hypothetical protein